MLQQNNDSTGRTSLVDCPALRAACPSYFSFLLFARERPGVYVGVT